MSRGTFRLTVRSDVTFSSTNDVEVYGGLKYPYFKIQCGLFNVDRVSGHEGKYRIFHFVEPLIVVILEIDLKPMHIRGGFVVRASLILLIQVHV